MATSSIVKKCLSTEKTSAFQLRQVSSRKGRKYTQLQLAAKKP